MKNLKTLLFGGIVLLSTVSMLFVSCSPDSAAPRATNDEDKAIVTDVVDDVAKPKDATASIDYYKAVDPYVNEAVNKLFTGKDNSGLTVDNVTFKFPEGYTYEGGIEGIANAKFDISFKDVDVTVDDVEITDLNGTIHYTGNPNTVTGEINYKKDGTEANIKYEDGGTTEAAEKLIAFYNEVFGETLLPKLIKAFLSEGIKVDGDKLSASAKGSIEYQSGSDAAGNTYNTIKTITLDSFSLNTKEAVQIQENGNKYSLEVNGKAKFDFEPDEEDADEQNLKKISISTATAKLGITTPKGVKHTIEITTSLEYPSSIAGVKIPFSFNLSSVKIDDQQIDNLSMYGLLISALAELFK